MLKERVSKIKTLEDGYPIYQSAHVEIRTMKPDELKPTSRYVLAGNLEWIEKMEMELKEGGFDIFDLDEVLEHPDYVVAPPLIENDGDVDCIVDGLHRLWLARIRGEDCKVIYVSRVNQDRPIIGRPIDWKDVRLRSDLPQDPTQRRTLREGLVDTSECLRKNYRDLSVLGSGGRRPRNGQRN